MQPWLATVERRISPTRTKPRTARPARLPGIRILAAHSRSSSPAPKTRRERLLQSRRKYISTQQGAASGWGRRNRGPRAGIRSQNSERTAAEISACLASDNLPSVLVDRLRFNVKIRSERTQLARRNLPVRMSCWVIAMYSGRFWRLLIISHSTRSPIPTSARTTAGRSSHCLDRCMGTTLELRLRPCRQPVLVLIPAKPF